MFTKNELRYIVFFQDSAKILINFLWFAGDEKDN